MVSSFDLIQIAEFKQAANFNVWSKS